MSRAPTARSAAPQVAVLTVAQDARDARLHRIVAALQHRGLEVGVVAVGAVADLPAPALATLPERPGFTRRFLAAARLARRVTCPVVVTLDPAMALSAWPFARLRRQRLVVDMYEDYGAVLLDRDWAHGPRRLLGRVAVTALLAVAGRADLTVVADDQVPPRAARQRLVVRNVPDPDSLPTPRPRDPRPRAVYVGDLRRSRGLDTMLETVAATTAWSLDLVGGLSDRSPDELAARLDELGLAERVRWHGRLPLADAWQVATGAWVGLAQLAPTPAYRVAMPTKVYEYLMVGLPVLATDLPRMSRFLRDHGVGIATDDPRAAASRLDAWARDPAELDRMVAAARRWRRGDRATSRPFARLADAIAALL